MNGIESLMTSEIVANLDNIDRVNIDPAIEKKCALQVYSSRNRPPAACNLSPS